MCLAVPGRLQSDSRELAQLWAGVLGTLQIELAGHTFTTWLAGTRASRLDGDRLFVEAANSFSADHLNSRLATVVERVAGSVHGAPLKVHFAARGAAVDSRGEAAAVAGPLTDCRLNADFRFENYVSGPANRMAFVTCQMILDPENRRLSPVTIHGRPGLGKTHLLHATVAGALDAGWSVALMGADEFTDRYIDKVRNRSERLGALRQARLLAIDDLQYLGGKTGTGEELATTIESVTAAGGVCVVASEIHPDELDLPQRLKSRLSAGTSAAVTAPGVDERRQMVELRAASCRTMLPGWAVNRVTALEVASVRALQGAVNALIALARCGDLDASNVDRALSRIVVREASRNPEGVGATLDAVARHFQMKPEEIAGRSREESAKDARAVAACVLHGSGMSLAQAGAVLGGRSKGTVSELVGRGEAILCADPALRSRLAG